jgi:hypothetical protein
MTNTDTLYFWVRTIKNPVIGFQYFHIRIGDFKGNYYKYTASTSILNAAHLVWKRYQFPLSGNSTFSRTMVGNMNLDSTNYVEFHADTWDYGYTLWLDGLQFSPCDPPIMGITENNNSEEQKLTNYPNPFSDKTCIRYHLTKNEQVRLSVYTVDGKLLQVLVNDTQQPGTYIIPFDATNLRPGVYFYSLVTSARIIVKKMIKW